MVVNHESLKINENMRSIETMRLYLKFTLISHHRYDGISSDYSTGWQPIGQNEIKNGARKFTFQPRFNIFHPTYRWSLRESPTEKIHYSFKLVVKFNNGLQIYLHIFSRFMYLRFQRVNFGIKWRKRVGNFYNLWQKNNKF